MTKKPSFQFYPGDWMKDPKVSMCQPATRGIWIDLLCAMHENEQSGEIIGNAYQLARLCRCSPEEMQTALSDLTVTKTADVTFCNEIVTVKCRRMWQEAKDRKNGRERVKRYRNKDEISESNGNVTNHSSSSTSVTEQVQAETAIPAARRIWKDGVDLLKQSGVSEKNARSLLGKLAKENGNELLAECIAVAQAKNPVNAEEFLIGVLKDRNKNTKPAELPTIDEVNKKREEFRKQNRSSQTAM